MTLRHFNLWDSLDGRRTANAGVRKIEPRRGDDIFFEQQADGRKNRTGMAGAHRGSGAVRHHANRAGSCFALARVMVGRLHPHPPQQQGQCQPCRPAYPETHHFPSLRLDSLKLITVVRAQAMSGKLLWIGMLLGSTQDSVWTHFQARGSYGRTHLRGT